MGVGLGVCIINGWRPTTDVHQVYKDATCEYLVSVNRVDLIDEHLDPEYKYREKAKEEIVE